MSFRLIIFNMMITNRIHITHFLITSAFLLLLPPSISIRINKLISSLIKNRIPITRQRRLTSSCLTIINNNIRLICLIKKVLLCFYICCICSCHSIQSATCITKNPNLLIILFILINTTSISLISLILISIWRI